MKINLISLKIIEQLLVDLRNSTRFEFGELLGGFANALKNGNEQQLSLMDQRLVGEYKILTVLEKVKRIQRVVDIFEFDFEFMIFTCMIVKRLSTPQLDKEALSDLADAFHGLSYAILDKDRLNRERYTRAYFKPFISRYPDLLTGNELIQIRLWSQYKMGFSDRIHRLFADNEKTESMRVWGELLVNA